MKTTKTIKNPSDLGERVRERRKSLNLTQARLALACGVGRRFIIELEDGKETCQLGLTLKVLKMLGFDIELSATEFNPGDTPATRKIKTSKRRH